MDDLAPPGAHPAPAAPAALSDRPEHHPRRTPRPHHADPVLVLVVAAGGVVGSGARYALTHAVPPWRGLPVATLTENLVGAFLLGLPDAASDACDGRSLEDVETRVAVGDPQ